MRAIYQIELNNIYNKISQKEKRETSDVLIKQKTERNIIKNLFAWDKNFMSGCEHD